MNKRIAYRITIISVLVIALFIAATMVIERATESKKDIPVLGEVQPFAFVNQDGASFGLEQLKGKISVVDFMFTSCHGPCPIMSDFMAHLYRAYETSAGIQFVSISVDPEVDTIPVLKQYASEKGVNDLRWNFLRGEIDSVKSLSENSFMLAADDLPGYHSIKFVLLDKDAKIRGYYNGTDALSIEHLKEDLNQLAGE